MVLSRATLRRDVFRFLYTTISGFNITGGYNVVSSFPEKTPSFPLVTIDPATFSEQLVGMKSSTRDNELDVVFTFYDLASNRKESVDNAVDDFIYNMWLAEPSIITQGFILNSVVDLPPTTIKINEQKLNKRIVEWKMVVTVGT